MQINEWVFLAILGFAITGSVLYATRKRKCPKCGTKSQRTGVAGSQYAQYYCPACDRTFFLEHWNNKEG
jgi:transposase-like protein